MATKRNTLTIRVPEDLKQRLEKVATLQGVSINQFALYAFTKEIADLEASSYRPERTAKALTRKP